MDNIRGHEILYIWLILVRDHKNFSDFIRLRIAKMDSIVNVLEFSEDALVVILVVS